LVFVGKRKDTKAKAKYFLFRVFKEAVYFLSKDWFKVAISQKPYTENW